MSSPTRIASRPQAVTNGTTYADPFRDVTLNVTYTRPDGTNVNFWGFHDGGDIWRMRFMPEQLGWWRYAASFSDGSLVATGSFLCVTSDIIVGFPGETEADFECTMEVAAAAEFDSCYPFQFSPRTGTRAAELTGQFVAADVVTERFQRLNHVLERSATRKHAERVGRIEEVLVEGPSKKDPMITSARTKQGKLVHFPYRDASGEQRALPAGTFADVEIISAAAHFLRAELREITARPRHRTKIAVTAL